jgi:hypothetical protein
MTFGEKMATAYSMRNWLICLKYGNRIKQASDWLLQERLGVDYDGTATPECNAINVLNNLLGNATYASTIPMGDKAHCYAFVSPDRRPVIALWTTDLADETGPVTGPTLSLGGLANKINVVNMMGSKVTPATGGAVKMSAYPIFLIGKPGTLRTVSAAVLRAAAASLGVESLTGYGQRISDTQVAFSVRNTFGTPIRGTMAAALTGQSARKLVDIAPGKTESIVVSSADREPGITTVDPSFTWTPIGSTSQSRFPVHLNSLYCPRAASPIDISTDPGAWPAKGIIQVPPHIITFKPPAELSAKYPDGQPWGGPGDLSATLSIAYDKDNLYLGFKVRDNVFSPAPTVGGAWSGDGIQIYFDPWLTGHAKLGTDWPSDDQVLDVWPGPNGIVVNREVTPDRQVAFLNPGPVDNVRSHFERTGDGYTLALAIPIRQLAPLELKPGGVFNFAFLINDNDGEYRKQGLSLTPAGTEPFQRWDLWPTVVLGT